MFFFLALIAAPTPQQINQKIVEVLPAVETQYKWFHRHPERSLQEMKTAAHLAEQLRALGLKVEEGVGKTGIVGVLKGIEKGPVVLYRADMDGLPVTEATGLPYASQNKGVMHACGHDVHMAAAIGALAVMAKIPFKGVVLFVGQPAEELGLGAYMMMDDPKFKRIISRVGRPRVALAIHDDATIPAGSVATRAGFATANVDSIDVTIYGTGGHGARPHQTRDPIVIGSEIVLSLQTIVSRRLKPGTRAVVTVGKFEAGTKHNIIPPSATLLLTVRSYDDETRARLLKEIERVVQGVAAAHDVPKKPKVEIKRPYTPAGYNDPAFTERLRTLFMGHLGTTNMHERPLAMGGEDFALFSKRLNIPGVMWWVGTVSPKLFKRKKPAPGLHSDKFAPDLRPTLKTAIQTVVWGLRSALDAP